MKKKKYRNQVFHVCEHGFHLNAALLIVFLTRRRLKMSQRILLCAHFLEGKRRVVNHLSTRRNIFVFVKIFSLLFLIIFIQC